MGWVVEQAGGKASTGVNTILDQEVRLSEQEQSISLLGRFWDRRMTCRYCVTVHAFILVKIRVQGIHPFAKQGKDRRGSRLRLSNIVIRPTVF